ncbi:MAG: aminoglycoside phosphotransferase family protein [Bacillota bacterium]|nr:aminoglycoside phosphotransferase family protein [Bacillota bacterium]
MNDIIDKIVDDTFHSNISQVEKIDGLGEVNEVYKVTVGFSDYIIRLQRGIHAITEYKKEAWCMKQAQKHQMYVPSVISINVCGNYTFMVEEFIHGINGSYYPDKLLVWQRLGEAARKLNEIPVKGFGCDLSNEDNGTFTDHFSSTLEKQIQYNLSQLTNDDLFITLNIYERERQPALIMLFLRLIGLQYQPCLCHGDLSPYNLIIDKDDHAYLIDFGCAKVHMPHYNLITVGEHSPAEFNAFLCGYGLTKETFKNMELEYVLLSLLHHFDTLRWAIYHLIQENWEPYIIQARNAAQIMFNSLSQ